MKEMECYYCYGIKQFNLGFFTEGTLYLSKCRGYKNTDEILLSYYYGEAIKQYELFKCSFAEYDDGVAIAEHYQGAKMFLALCEGYKDSEYLLLGIEKLYEARNFFRSLSSNLYGVYTLKDAKITIDGAVLTISAPKFTSTYGVDCSLFLEYDMKDESFSAELENMYGSMYPPLMSKMLESLLLLFTGLEDLDDFISEYENVNNWDEETKEMSFFISFNEYTIDVRVNEKNYRKNWSISAER